MRYRSVIMRGRNSVRVVPSGKDTMHSSAFSSSVQPCLTMIFLASSVRGGVLSWCSGCTGGVVYTVLLIHGSPFLSPILIRLIFDDVSPKIIIT